MTMMQSWRPTLIVVALCLLLGACGGKRSYTVTAEAGEGGDASPESQRVTQGNTGRITFTPDPGYMLDAIDSDCDGSLAGNVYTTGRVFTDCTVSATFTLEGASLSGIISPAAAITVDGTVNDRFSTFADNSTFANAQYLNNLMTVHGFASAEPTGGDGRFERFHETPDPHDFYRAFLQAGQIIQLQIVDFEGLDLQGEFQGDLDLYLYNHNQDFVSADISTSELAQLTVPASGDYFIEVRAVSGISKYVLRLLPPLSEIGQVPPPAEFVPDEVIITFRSGAVETLGSNARERVNQSLGQSLGQRLKYRHQDHSRPALARLDRSLQIASAGPGPMAELRRRNPESYARVSTLKAIKQLRQHPDVLHAEPNYRLHPQFNPNDTYFHWQWHYQAIQLPQAWSISTGVRPAGQEVIVAVIDTGVFLSHPDLAGQLVAGYDFISDLESARDGDGIDDNPDDPGDSPERGQSSWHGTHVAGTIAAATNNGRGVAGVSWGARIMPLRALSKSGGTSYDVMQSVRYAARLPNDSNTVPPRAADIINLSLGRSGSPSAQEQALYNQVRAQGILLVAAAGNNDSATPMYPAAYPAVLSVGATDALNQRAFYSNFGGSLSLVAPGGDLRTDLNGDGQPDGIFSTLVDDRTGTRQPAYGFYMGTSMAAPHVSGVLALMKAVYPDLTPGQVDQMLINGDLTDDLGDPGRDDLYGHGLLNAFRAVQAARVLAEGGDPDDLPPLLVATPAILNLEQLGVAQITITNQGGGDPVITQVTSEDPWLQATPAQVGPDGLGTYNITIDRSGLNQGTYQSQLRFISTDQELVVVVRMQMGAVSVDGELTQLYVLLLDRETREPVYQAETQITDTGELHYQFDWVAGGSYWVIAGSDIDVDLIICQSGESCGAYPSLSDQEPVVVGGTPVVGVDFVADILGNVSSLFSPFGVGAQLEGISREATPIPIPPRRVAH